MNRIPDNDQEQLEQHNKCDECCKVVGCSNCGPCPEHDQKQDQEA